MTDDRRRTIDKKFEVQVFLAGEASVGEAAVAKATVVKNVLESVGQCRTLLAVKNTGHLASGIQRTDA
jgi:hypothetical protein